MAARQLRALLQTSWAMATVFWVSWALGDTMATVLFALVSFLTLREFITLSPTRRGDHRSLVLAFFVVLPLQYVMTTHSASWSATPSCSGASWSASMA